MQASQTTNLPNKIKQFMSSDSVHGSQPVNFQNSTQEMQ